MNLRVPSPDALGNLIPCIGAGPESLCREREEGVRRRRVTRKVGAKNRRECEFLVCGA